MSTDGKYERYQATLEHVRYEGNLMVAIFRNYLWPHTVFLTVFFGARLPGAELPGFDWLIWVSAFLGLLWSVLWMAIFCRNSAYYVFRMAQAREAEPNHWNLIKGRGERFSNGERIRIGDDHQWYQMPWLARTIRTQRAAPIFIWSFVLVYLILFVLSGPWWCCCQGPVASEIGQC